ncbi:HEPN domain-containing protein [Desulfovibrio sp. DV]|uniref:HEPN domain-containing protein n=1 Tax=Desulfovibrio sp. DV TaxID=1844708 RepID=UPI00094B89E6|nr:HEPN domain-containing protein [Desulfovibrio sp. DV]
MQVQSLGDKKTYLYLNGLKVLRPVCLDKQVELLPAHCDPDPNDIIAVSKTEVDIGIATIFLRRIGSQLKIVADNQKQLADTAWNALWMVSLLSSVFDYDIVCNFQSDQSAEKFSNKSEILTTNYDMRGLVDRSYIMTEDDSIWIKRYFCNGFELLANSSTFMNAVTAMCQYRWFPHPRTKIAVLWSGIEGLFDIHSEISFRLSLYIANYISPDDKKERIRLFNHVKSLYNHRSVAVHGAAITEKARSSVQDSALLLNRLIRICVERNELPNTKELIL